MNGSDYAERFPHIEEMKDDGRGVRNNGYRVRISIYDEAEGRDAPITETDEPLFENPEEIAHQAERTRRYFLQKLIHDQ